MLTLGMEFLGSTAVYSKNFLERFQMENAMEISMDVDDHSGKNWNFQQIWMILSHSYIDVNVAFWSRTGIFIPHV